MVKRFIILLGIILIFITGCNSSKVEQVNEGIVKEEPVVEEKAVPEEEQELILKEYYDLLKADSQNLAEFVDDNIIKLGTGNVDNIIISYEDHLRSKNTSATEIISTLLKYNTNASDEVKSYLHILSAEADKPFTDGEAIYINLEEILNRAKYAEKHLKDFPSGETYRRIYDYYSAYITGAILGVGNQYIYANEGTSTIKEEVIDGYKRFIDENKDSYTSKILTSYLEDLSLDKMDLSGQNVARFYDDLDEIIKLSSRE